MGVPRPKRYTVEGDTVDIVFKAPLKRFKDGYPMAGRHTPTTSTRRAVIEVGPGMTHDGERATVLHEILHDCADRANLVSQLPYKEHELVFTLIDSWLYHILQENPQLVEWLMERRPS